MTNTFTFVLTAAGASAVIYALVALFNPRISSATKNMRICCGFAVFWLVIVVGKLAGIHIDVPQRAAPFIAAVLLLGMAFYWVWYFPRTRSLMRHWATRNGFEIIDLKHRWIFKGPYFWNHSRCQPVFRVRVRDRHGNERAGWVRCGGWFTGVITDEATVIWDEDKYA